MLSLFLIEGQNVREENLRSVSIGNAKQLVVGNAFGFGVILYGLIALYLKNFVIGKVKSEKNPQILKTA